MVKQFRLGSLNAALATLLVPINVVTSAHIWAIKWSDTLLPLVPSVCCLHQLTSMLILMLPSVARFVWRAFSDSTYDNTINCVAQFVPLFVIYNSFA